MKCDLPPLIPWSMAYKGPVQEDNSAGLADADLQK